MTNADIISLLDRLGGPKVSENDLAWMWDLPTGKDLLNFLSAQAQGNAKFALDDIALEEEEYDLWTRAIEAGLVAVEPPSSSDGEGGPLSTEYIPPFMLQMKLDDIEKEQMLLDDELCRLNERVIKARMMATQTHKSHKTLSTAQQDTAKAVTDLEHQLSQFSLSADSAVSSTVRAARHLVADHLALDQSVKQNPQLIDLITLLAGTYTNITHVLTKHFSADGREPLSKESAHLLQQELQRLSKSIISLEHRYMTISNEGNHQNCSKIDDPEKQGIQDSGWVEETTEHIWNAEQARNISQEIDILIKITTMIEDEILPSIVFINVSLAALKNRGEETLVIIQALLDELDDIEVDVSRTRNTSTAEINAQSLEASILALLKRLRPFRPSDLPPLTLVNRSNILTELQNIRSRYESTRTDMKKMALAGTLDAHAMTKKSRDCLSSLLKHSPLNTTPPVSLPPKIQQEVCNARRQLAEVSQILSETPNEISTSSRARRRMDAFIQANIS